MPAVRALELQRTGEVKRAIGRILVFLGVFLGLLAAGGFLLQLSADETPRGVLMAAAVMLAAALAASALLIRLADGRPVGALGLAVTRRTPYELGAGLIIGVCAIALAVLLMILAGGLRYTSEPGSPAAWLNEAGGALALLAVAAMAEEVLFRGYAFQWLARATGPIVATVAGSLLFAAAHVWNPDWTVLAMLNLFLAGVLLSFAYLRTRSLWFAGALHLGWNWAMASLFDLPVSGVGFFDAPGYEPVLLGAGWLTGGEFGPEGGLAATLAVLAALVFVLRSPRLEESEAMRARRPLVDRELAGAAAA